MKTLLFLGFVLLLAPPLYGETYSWVDDSGTYNYTEDYSKVPEKYRKKVDRRGDLQQDVKPPESQDPGNKSKQAEKSDTKSAVVPAGEQEGLYGGKSYDAWRKELDALEAELSGIEQRMELLRKQIYDPQRYSKVQLDVLIKDYDDSRSEYAQKYKNYTNLIETVRKAGIPVEIKK